MVFKQYSPINGPFEASLSLSGHRSCGLRSALPVLVQQAGGTQKINHTEHGAQGEVDCVWLLRRPLASIHPLSIDIIYYITYNLFMYKTYIYYIL